jgi:phage-related minor tail protein
MKKVIIILLITIGLQAQDKQIDCNKSYLVVEPSIYKYLIEEQNAKIKQLENEKKELKKLNQECKNYTKQLKKEPTILITMGEQK